MSEPDATVAKGQCLEIVTRFFGHYDRREYPQLFALMAPDGVWHRNADGAVRVGPELEAALAKRLPNLTVVHLITNLVADVTGADSIVVRGLMTIFRDDNGKLSAGPAKLTGAGSILQATIGCRKIGNDWRIQSVRNDYLFRS